MNLKLLNSLVILKNAALNNKAKVLVLHTKDICKILELLYEEGVIQSFSKQTSSNRIYVHLRSFPLLSLCLNPHLNVI
jgi:ribosomal protein S8